MRLLFFLLFSISLHAQQSIQPALSTFLQDPTLKNASLSITVTNIESGEVLTNYNSDRALIPASSLKTITTATALAVLGADYQFKTELQYSGSIDQLGTLKGDIYIKGYGDPTLGSDRYTEAGKMPQVLNAFVEAIKAAGIKAIDGRVIGDSSFFPSAPVASTWQWEDMGNYYGAGAFGLNFHENQYWLDFQQHPIIDSLPKVLGTRPEVPFIFAESLVTSGAPGSGDNAYIYGAPFRHHVTIRGTIPTGKNTVFTIKGAVPDPAIFAAFQLTKALEENGIKISDMPQSIFNEDNKTRHNIYTQKSPQLLDIVREANKESINLYCEVLLKTTGLKLTNSSDFDAATEALQDYWKEKGIDTEGMRLRDGSGLSARTHITSRQMTEIMRLIAQDATLFEQFKSSLSTGKSGTLKGMFKGKAAFNNIWAKSGSMTGVRSYTGYARTKTGDLLSFSIIANNFTCKSSVMRRKMEALMLSFCE